VKVFGCKGVDVFPSFLQFVDMFGYVIAFFGIGFGELDEKIYHSGMAVRLMYRFERFPHLMRCLARVGVL
jgi:hypothetical protein